MVHKFHSGRCRKPQSVEINSKETIECKQILAQCMYKKEVVENRYYLEMLLVETTSGYMLIK